MKRFIKERGSKREALSRTRKYAEEANTKNRFVSGVRNEQKIHYISNWVTFPSEIPPVLYIQELYIRTMYRGRLEHTTLLTST